MLNGASRKSYCWYDRWERLVVKGVLVMVAGRCLG